MYKKENIQSIRELMAEDGGRNLTPIFKGSQYPVFVHVSRSEYVQVRGDTEKMKDLAIAKLNSKKYNNEI